MKRIAGIRSKAVVVLAVLLSSGAACAAANDVASLYGPQPPEDASYLRLLNLSPQAVRVALAGSDTPRTLAPGAATRFSVVARGTPLRVTVDGMLLREASGDASPGDAITVALRRDASGWHGTPVAARYGRANGLKATLRVFNFVPGCAATISVDGDGPTVFARVASGTQDARAINPLDVKLVGQCGKAISAPLPLPMLAAGDSYSLFVNGNAAKPVLSGARDVLAWPPATH
ncbi:alginate O-acetyltransferase AlgF [Paraburkholderia phymatum]|uniref:alginate O-acetyltransferase AlgF n=1 Tax=Paraburkholderia phymatum TaxID=148447 RepID=UPI00317360FC